MCADNNLTLAVTSKEKRRPTWDEKKTVVCAPCRFVTSLHVQSCASQEL